MQHESRADKKKINVSWYCLKVEQAKFDLLVQLYSIKPQRELRDMRSKPTRPFW